MGKGGGSGMAAGVTPGMGADVWGNNYDASTPGHNQDAITQAFSMQGGEQDSYDDMYMDEGMFMPSFEMPEMPDYGKMLAEMQAASQTAQVDAAAESQRLADIASYDNLFSMKYEAATKAAADVNQQIADESAHALTRGLDYVMTDELKQERVNNLFADYWSEDNESSLSGYIGKYGMGDRKWDLNVKRGTGTGSKGALAEGAKAGEQVKKSTILTDEEEDPLGGKKVILGA